MSSEAAWPGEWWLPTNDGDKRHGVLQRREDGRLRLRLTEGFSTFVAAEENPEWMVEGDSRLPVLLGSTGNRAITLLDCWSTKPFRPDLVPWLEAKDQELIVNSALIGTHLSNTEDKKIESMVFEFENLTSFLQPHPSSMARLAIEEGYSKRSFEPLAEINYDGLTIELGLQIHTGSTDVDRVSQTFGTTARAQVRIRAVEPSSLMNFDRFAKPLMDLVTFTSDQPSAIVSQTGIDSMGREFDVLELQVVNASLTELPQKSFRYLFQADQVDLALVLENWLKVWFSTNPAISLMLANRYQSNFVEFQALALGVTVEVLHKRIRKDAKVRGEPLFTQVKTRILRAIQAAIDLGDCDSNDKVWVASLLRDDLGFKRRAMDLLSLADSKRLARVCADTDGWAKEISRARNGLAHGSVTGSDDPVRLLIEQTRWVLAVILMEQIGVPAVAQIPYEGALRYLDDLTARTKRASSEPT